MTRQRKQDGPRLKAMAPRVCEILREEEGD